MPRFIGFKSSCPEVFLEESVLKISRKFIDRPCRSMISTRSLHNFIEITLQHECSPVNVLHIFRTPFPKNTSGWLLLNLLLYFNAFKLQISYVVHYYLSFTKSSYLLQHNLGIFCQKCPKTNFHSNYSALSIYFFKKNLY